MKEAFDDLQMVKHENALTEEDIRSALEAYDKEYYNCLLYTSRSGDWTAAGATAAPARNGRHGAVKEACPEGLKISFGQAIICLLYTSRCV